MELPVELSLHIIRYLDDESLLMASMLCNIGYSHVLHELNKRYRRGCNITELAKMVRVKSLLPLRLNYMGCDVDCYYPEGNMMSIIDIDFNTRKVVIEVNILPMKNPQGNVSTYICDANSNTINNILSKCLCLYTDISYIMYNNIDSHRLLKIPSLIRRDMNEVITIDDEGRNTVIDMLYNTREREMIDFIQLYASYNMFIIVPHEIKNIREQIKECSIHVSPLFSPEIRDELLPSIEDLLNLNFV